MLQTVDGQEVYVVDLPVVPELPITWDLPEEEPYARALHGAIQDGTISKPGKYGIHLLHLERVPDGFEIVYEVAYITE